MAPDVIAGRDDVGSRLEEARRQLGRQTDPVRRVLAVHDAEVGFEVVPELREAIGHRSAPGGAEDVADEEQLQRVRFCSASSGARQCRGRLHLDVHVLAVVLRVAGEPGPLDVREVDDVADLRRAGGDGRADRERRVGPEVRERDDDPGEPEGWMSIRTP